MVIGLNIDPEFYNPMLIRVSANRLIHKSYRNIIGIPVQLTEER
ncbi:hypothetical protein BH11BAC2_BH11BAC2_24640 [soil metagenome]